VAFGRVEYKGLRDDANNGGAEYFATMSRKHLQLRRSQQGEAQVCFVGSMPGGLILDGVTLTKNTWVAIAHGEHVGLSRGSHNGEAWCLQVRTSDLRHSLCRAGPRTVSSHRYPRFACAKNEPHLCPG
jgi:hypothetical protein